MLIYLNDNENEVADFINEGQNYSRTADEIIHEFEERKWPKSKTLKILGDLISNPPRVLIQTIQGKGEIIYTTTPVMSRRNEMGEIE